MKKFKIMLVLLAIGCSSSDNESNETQSTSGYKVYGIIKEESTNHPVQNAIISLDNVNLTTETSDINGQFEIDNVIAGEHTIEIKKGTSLDGYTRISKQFIVTNDSIDIGELKLPDLIHLNTTPQIINNLENNTVTIDWPQYLGNSFTEYRLYKKNTSDINIDNSELIHTTTDIDEVSFTLELPYNSETYYRVFVFNELELLSGSNVLNVTIGDSDYSGDQVALNVDYEFYLNENEEHSLYFDAQEGFAYSIQWFDSWFDTYTANSIYVSAHNQEASNYYFQNERLIQMSGSPMPIIAQANERVYLDIEGFNGSTAGTYGVKITELASSNYSINTNYNIGVDLGEVKLIDFDAEANKDYKITVLSTVPLGAYGDGIETHFSLFNDSSVSFTNYKETIPNTCCHQPIEYNVNVNANQKVYIIIDGAYWFLPNNVDFIIEEL